MNPLNLPIGVGAVFVGNVAVQKEDVPGLQRVVVTLGFGVSFSGFYIDQNEAVIGFAVNTVLAVALEFAQKQGIERDRRRRMSQNVGVNDGAWKSAGIMGTHNIAPFHR